eukprot:6182235-Pleurochrysis_carterae.AAC.2
MHDRPRSPGRGRRGRCRWPPALAPLTQSLERGVSQPAQGRADLSGSLREIIVDEDRALPLYGCTTKVRASTAWRSMYHDYPKCNVLFFFAPCSC